MFVSTNSDKPDNLLEDSLLLAIPTQPADQWREGESPPAADAAP